MLLRGSGPEGTGGHGNGAKEAGVISRDQF